MDKRAQLTKKMLETKGAQFRIFGANHRSMAAVLADRTTSSALLFDKTVIK